jgi:hypothetical protein
MSGASLRKKFDAEKNIREQDGNDGEMLIDAWSG